MSQKGGTPCPHIENVFWGSLPSFKFFLVMDLNPNDNITSMFAHHFALLILHMFSHGINDTWCRIPLVRAFHFVHTSATCIIIVNQCWIISPICFLAFFFFWKLTYLFLHILSLAQPFHTNCNHLLCGMVSPITTIIIVIGSFGGVVSPITIANNFWSFFGLVLCCFSSIFFLVQNHVFFLLFCLKFFSWVCGPIAT